MLDEKNQNLNIIVGGGDLPTQQPREQLLPRLIEHIKLFINILSQPFGNVGITLMSVGVALILIISGMYAVIHIVQVSKHSPVATTSNIQARNQKSAAKAAFSKSTNEKSNDTSKSAAKPTAKSINSSPTVNAAVQSRSLSSSSISTTAPATSSGTSGTSSTSSITGSQPVGDPAGVTWTRVFDDEFNGSSIDTTKWVIFGAGNGCPGTAATCHPVHNNNNVTSTPVDCSETGGNLVLDQPGDGTGCNLASAWTGYTGTLTADGTNAWELAVGDYVEARVWVSAATASPYNPVANWPAFWTSGAHWPRNGEYDIIEGAAKATCSYHTDGDGPDSSNDNDPDVPITPVCTPAPTGLGIGQWAGAWHVYGVYRSSKGARFYWDGVNVTCSGSHAAGCADPLPITDDGGLQALRFNIGSYGTSNPTTVNGSSGDMLVDWVHGYTGG